MYITLTNGTILDQKGCRVRRNLANLSAVFFHLRIITYLASRTQQLQHTNRLAFCLQLTNRGCWN